MVFLKVWGSKRIFSPVVTAKHAGSNSDPSPTTATVPTSDINLGGVSKVSTITVAFAGRCVQATIQWSCSMVKLKLSSDGSPNHCRLVKLAANRGNLAWPG